MIRKVFIATCAFVLTFSGNIAYAQSVVMEQDVNKDTIVRNFGKNRSHYIGTHMSFGILSGQIDSDSVQLKDAESSRFNWGIYYKARVSNIYSVVLSADYHFTQFDFTSPEDTKYDRLNMSDLGLDLANRFNFGKRGNAIGNYLELGASIDYTVHTKRESKQVLDDESLDYKSRKMEFTGLRYVNPLNYYAHARLGFNKFVLTADYRLSNVMKDNVGFNLPPLYFGFRLDMGG